MSRARRMATLAKLAALVERNQRRVLGKAVAGLNEARAQHELLERYLDEYRQRWLQQGVTGISGTELRRSSAFQEQLGTTVELQSRRVRLASREADKVAETWSRARLRKQNLNRLYALACKQQARVAENREQREIDDLVGGRRRS